MVTRRAGRSIAAAIVLSIVLAGRSRARRWPGSSRSLPGGPAELQHDGVQRLRHARDAHPSRVQSRGPGLRGLVTANSSGRGTVPRGAVALVATSAPAGTRFTTFRWAGSLRRATAATRCSSTRRDRGSSRSR